MNLNQLRYFIQVCKYGSFSKAAEKSFISPQGMNATILRLERELGVRLFARSNNGVSLTQDGEYLYRTALEISRMVDECQSYFDTKKKNEDTIVLSHTPELTCAMPSEFLSMMLGKYHLDMRACGSITCEEDVANGESDCAFTNGPYFRSDLIYDHCFTKIQYLITHKSNPLAQAKGLCMGDLKNSSFIMPDGTYKFLHVFKEKCQKAGFNPNVAFYSPNFATVFTLLKKYPSWVGYSFDFYINQVKDEEIAILPIVDSSCSWDVYLAHKPVVRNEYVARFVSDVLHYLGREDAQNE